MLPARGSGNLFLSGGNIVATLTIGSANVSGGGGTGNVVHNNSHVSYQGGGGGGDRHRRPRL